MSLVKSFDWRVCGASDQGKKRQQNQDAIGWQVNSEKHWLSAVVSDGMGGHAAGEVASGIARTTFLDAIEQAFGEPDTRDESSQQRQSRLHQLIDSIHEKIRESAALDHEQTGMGSTLVGLVIQEQGCWVVNIGDSRCYRLRDGQLSQLTHDQTLVQDWIDQGEISQEKAEQSPYRNVLTQALGSVDHLKPQVLPCDLHCGDKFLLCSDGLSNCLSNAFIRETLQTHQSLASSAQQLLNEALQAGAPDNVSFVVVAHEPTGDSQWHT